MKVSPILSRKPILWAFLLGCTSQVSARSNSIVSVPISVDDIVGANPGAPAGSCLGGYDFSIQFEGNCVYSDIKDEFAAYLEETAPDCDHGVEAELAILLGVNEDNVAAGIAGICEAGWDAYVDSKGYPWANVTGYGPEWDKEYFDGNTYWNEEHETNYNSTVEGEPANRLKEDAYRVGGLYEDEAQRTSIEFPSHLENFDDCAINSVMCCWPSDRQANDNNGNCATPYDENCVDADPGDNTDLCAVDMARSSSNSVKVPDGLAFYEGNGEGPIHCHGLAWGTDDMEADARYKGNNLFYVSMYDHMYQRGYVRNVPGAPMCGCVEKMPIVSRSDCTEIDADETWRLSWKSGDNTLTSSLRNVELDFNACQGDGGNNDLYKFYKRLRREGRVPEEDYQTLKKTIVGNHQCHHAIDELYFQKGYEIDYVPPEGWTQVYGKGAFGAYESDTSYWELGSPYVKQDGTSSSPVFYIMRKCYDCYPSHKKIIYKRLTPVPDDLNIPALFTFNWVDTNNVLGVDFDLFSSMEDALSGTNPWSFCNYNDYGVGFPRDCGPDGRVNHQFTSIWRGGRSDAAYYVWHENTSIGNSISVSPTPAPVQIERPLDVLTPNWYNYRPVVDLTGSGDSGYVVFTVKTSSDAFIALGKDTDHNGDHYEIVLGGWGNTRSRIRGRNGDPTLDEYIGNVLDPFEDRKFRVSWDASEVRVEQQGGTQWFEILNFSNRDTSGYNHPINYMMIATGWGSSGSWNILDYSAGSSTVYYTSNAYCYLPLVDFDNESEGSVLFSVKVERDAYISLGEGTNHHDPHYEIALGFHHNKYSAIRAWNSGPEISPRRDGPVLNRDEYVLFRVSWDETSLKLERSPDHDESTLVEIMKYEDRNSEVAYNYKIKHLMVTTYHISGLWKVLESSS